MIHLTPAPANFAGAGLSGKILLMKKNIGKKDRIIRLVISIALAIVAFLFSGIIKLALLLVSVFILYEALAGWCAFYAIIGKNTCPAELFAEGDLKENGH